LPLRVVGQPIQQFYSVWQPFGGVVELRPIQLAGGKLEVSRMPQQFGLHERGGPAYSLAAFQQAVTPA
jgi:hypothetical protein